MNATILNGAPADDVYTDGVTDLLAAMLHDLGRYVRIYQLRHAKIGYCLGCFECWTKSPGVCRIDDEGREVAAACINADQVYYVTPVTFGSYSSVLKKAIDRNICLIEPFFMDIAGETHHHPRYDAYPSIAGVGVLPEPDEVQEQIFRTLIERNALNLHAPMHRTTILYRNQTWAEQQAALDLLM